MTRSNSTVTRISPTNPSPNLLRGAIIENTRSEVEAAIAEFIEKYGDASL